MTSERQSPAVAARSRRDGSAVAATARESATTSAVTDSPAQDPLLTIVSNLSQFHREHEK